jgi:hypothetical protein
MGLGGNREVPPSLLIGAAEANSKKEGGTWGKPGFPHGTEPEASDVHPPKTSIASARECDVRMFSAAISSARGCPELSVSSAARSRS